MAKKTVTDESNFNDSTVAVYFEEQCKAAESSLNASPASAETWLDTWKTFRDQTIAVNSDLSDYDRFVLFHIGFNFDRVKEYAKAIVDGEARLDFFQSLEAAFKQFLIDADVNLSTLSMKLADNGFGRKCEIEIELLEKQLQRSKQIGNDENDPAKPGLKRQLAMILLDDLFPNLNDASNTKKATGYFDEPIQPASNEIVSAAIDLSREETERTELLTSVCPLFACAKPETQGMAWAMMKKFTRKQWAYFADKTSILKSSTKVERARQIEAICRLTNLRELFGTEPSNEDKLAVSKVITILKADAIKAKTA